MELEQGEEQSRKAKSAQSKTFEVGVLGCWFDTKGPEKGTIMIFLKLP